MRSDMSGSYERRCLELPGFTFRCGQPRQMSTTLRFQVLNDAMAWMMKCFGRSTTLQDMMVGLCIWRVARRDETVFTGKQITEELDIPYSTATRLLRAWIERGVIENSTVDIHDGREATYRLTEKGISMRDVVTKWDR